MKVIQTFNAQPVKIPHVKSLLTRKQARYVTPYFSCIFITFISWMFITPSFKKSLIVEQFQGNYLKPWPNGLASWTLGSTWDSFWPGRTCTCFDLRSRSSRSNIHTIFTVWPPDPDQHSGARSSSCYSNLLAKEMQGMFAWWLYFGRAGISP